jgi:hypothetical protein
MKPVSWFRSWQSQTVWVWLCGLVGMLYLVQWRLKSIYAAAYAPYRWSDYVTVPGWAAALPVLNWPLRLAFVLSMAFLLWLEYRHGTVSQALREMLASHRRTLAALLVVGVLSGSYYLLPGHIALSTDAEAYTGFAAFVRNSIRMGRWPIWTNYGGMGTPLLQFYSPLYLASVALAGLVQDNLFEATKAVQLGAHLGSVVGMYAFVYRRSGSRLAAFASMWTYGFAFYRYQAIVNLGLLHVGMVFLLLPWLFFCGEQFLRQRSGYLARCGLTVLIGLLLLAHPHYGLFASLLWWVDMELRLWTAPGATRFRDRLGANGVTLLGVLAGLLLGAGPFVGTLAESQYVSFATNLLPTDFQLGTLSPEQVFSFEGSFLGPAWFGGYLGLSLTALALAAFAAGLWKRVWPDVTIGVLFVASLVLVLAPGHAWFDRWVEIIPFGRAIYVFDTPGRYLVFVLFLGTVLVGSAVTHAGSLLNALACRFHAGIRRPWEALAALSIIVVISIEMIPLLMRVNSLRPPNYWTVQGRTEAYQWIQANVADPTARIVQPELSLPDVHIFLYTERPSLNSTAHEIPYYAGRTIAHLQSRLKTDLAAGNFRAATWGWLYLTDTAAVVTGLPVTEPAPSEVAFTNTRFTVFAVRARSPILASATLVPASESDNLDTLLAAMHLDADRNSADGLPVFKTLPPASGPATRPVEVRVVSHVLDSDRVRLTYALSGPAYLQLSYAYYPFLRVEVDAQPVPYTQSAFGMIVVRSDSGTHTVEIRPYLSPLRQMMLGLTAMTLPLIGVAFIFIKPRFSEPPDA